MDEETRDLLIVFAIVALIGWMWFYSGGKERAISELLNVSVGQSQPSAYSVNTQKQPTPVYQNSFAKEIEQYNEIDRLRGQISQLEYEKQTGGIIQNKSPYFEKVDIAPGSIGLNDANREYVIVSADKTNAEPITITGWTLVSVGTGSSATIGKAAVLPFVGGHNSEEAIRLYPGEVATVVTGTSPMGTSFRLNKCVGYFEQFNSFYPSISRGCPRLGEEQLPKKPNALPDACVDYINTLPSCVVPYTSYPDHVTLQCRQYISQEVGYDRCVSKHKGDADFYQNEWQLYLGRSGSLWKARKETIELRDAQGQVVDRYSY